NGAPVKASLTPGLTHELRFVVTASKTVPALYPEAPEFVEMPAVFATGFMVGMVEWACIRAIGTHLEPGELTVGVHVDLSHLTTFGCQMNAHDSERMKGLLERLGYREAERRDDADLILFNTCTIRGSAGERFIGNLGDAKRVKRLRPDAVVAVGGCWAQSQK